MSGCLTRLVGSRAVPGGFPFGACRREIKRTAFAGTALIGAGAFTRSGSFRGGGSSGWISEREENTGHNDGGGEVEGVIGFHSLIWNRPRRRDAFPRVSKARIKASPIFSGDL